MLSGNVLQTSPFPRPRNTMHAFFPELVPCLFFPNHLSERNLATSVQIIPQTKKTLYAYDYISFFPRLGTKTASHILWRNVPHPFYSFPPIFLTFFYFLLFFAKTPLRVVKREILCPPDKYFAFKIFPYHPLLAEFYSAYLSLPPFLESIFFSFYFSRRINGFDPYFHSTYPSQVPPDGTI